MHLQASDNFISAGQTSDEVFAHFSVIDSSARVAERVGLWS